MRTAVVLTTIALAVIFLLGVIASLHEDRVVTTFQADEERYQREREARRAAAERARFLAATPQPLARKRTPFGSGSIEVPGEVTSSSYGTTTSLRWPDGYELKYVTYGAKEALFHPTTEHFADGSVLEYGRQHSDQSDEIVRFRVGGAEVLLADTTAEAQARALTTLRTFRAGPSLDCGGPPLPPAMETPLVHPRRPLPTRR